ncbi:MAG TPA: hypothetical protein VGA04_11000 [Streptosporangiaceae bacterium]
MKSFDIGKRLVYEAWEKVRANGGAPGVDAVSIGMFEEQLKDNLYRLDVRAFFDSVPHSLLLKAVAHHQRAVGPAVHLPVAGRADGDAGRDRCAAGEGNPARLPDLTYFG